ncbi:MAG TPA: hypothetical protein VMM15_23395 [Bradyrhizobium sp.]|nr:hypothetical protein [Bradyrhizobium sp.]
MVILLNDSGIAAGVCRVGAAYQQPLQFNKCREVHARRAHAHPGASDRIEHPVGDGNDHARRAHNAQESTGCSLRYAADADLAAEIGVPAVLHFQFLPDMGRMNG